MSVIERPLTVIERLLHAVSECYDGDGMPVFAARCSGPWSADSFHKALSAVQSRHPLLQSRVVEPRRGWPCFQLDPQAPSIPLEVLDANSGVDWEQTALRHSEQPFDVAQAPLCRFSVLPDRSGDGFHMIASFHHSIVDAVSMLALLRELFNRLAGLPAEVGVCDEEYAFRAMQPTSLWQRLRLTGQLLGKCVFQKFRPAAGIDPEASSPGGCLRVVWPESLTEDFVQRCRRERTTVFGALAAGVLQSLAEREAWGNVPNLQLQVPVDIRHLYAPRVDRTTLGCFAGIMDFPHADPLASPFWDLARRCRRNVQHEMSWRMPNCWDHLMSRVAFTPRWLKPLQRMTAGVNNLGRCETVSAGPWRLEEFSWFARSRHLGACVAVNTATVNGCLNLTLQADRASRESLQDLGDRITERIAAEGDCSVSGELTAAA